MGQSLGLVQEDLNTFSLKTLTISTPASAVVSLKKPITVLRLGSSQAGWWTLCCSNWLVGSCFSQELCFALLLP